MSSLETSINSESQWLAQHECQAHRDYTEIIGRIAPPCNWAGGKRSFSVVIVNAGSGQNQFHQSTNKDQTLATPHLLRFALHIARVGACGRDGCRRSAHMSTIRNKSNIDTDQTIAAQYMGFY